MVIQIWRRRCLSGIDAGQHDEKVLESNLGNFRFGRVGLCARQLSRIKAFALASAPEPRDGAEAETVRGLASSTGQRRHERRAVGDSRHLGAGQARRLAYVEQFNASNPAVALWLAARLAT